MVDANASTTIIGGNSNNVEKEKQSPSVIPPNVPTPPWLHDLKQLVPLQAAFEEEVKEKSDVIDEYENQVQYKFYLTYNFVL